MGAGRVHLAVQLPDPGEVGFAAVVLLAQTAERGMFDFVLFDDFTVLAALAAVTETIGLVGSVDPDSAEPFTVTRQLATLDHLSDGRAGWRAVGSGSHTDEFLMVVAAFWDSWAPDAVIADEDSGTYVVPERIHTVTHRGARFASSGVATLPAGPQGRGARLQNTTALHAMSVGRCEDPMRVADDIELRVRSGVCEGFILRPEPEHGLDDFVNEVVPLLQSSGALIR